MQEAPAVVQQRRSSDRLLDIPRNLTSDCGEAPASGADASTSRLTPASLARWLDIERPEARRQILQERLAALGFVRTMVLRTVRTAGQSLLVGMHADGPDVAWASDYARLRLIERDPRPQVLTRTGLPCVWDMPGLQAEAERQFGVSAAREFCRAVGQAGSNSGLMFAVHAGALSEWRLVSLESGRTGCDWITDGLIAQTALLATCVAEHQLPMAIDTPSARSRAADVQQQILDCLQKGMVDKVIADRLGLTLHNVDYHLRRLRSRYGARNRVQLLEAVRCESAVRC